MGDLHVLHEGLASEAELVADGTAGGAGPADQGVVLLEHDTLLQLLYGWRVKRVSPARAATTPHHQARKSTPARTRETPQSDATYRATIALRLALGDQRIGSRCLLYIAAVNAIFYTFLLFLSY